MRSLLRKTAAVLGVVSLLAAAIIAFVVVPGQAQLPADTDSDRAYEGQVAVLLNSEALAAGDLGNLLLRDLPIQIAQNVAVTGVADGVADVTEASTISLPDGSTLLQTGATYQVDRKTMVAEGDAQGLVIGWPIEPEAADSLVWSGPLQIAVPAVYDGMEERAGIDTLKFSAVESGRVVDQAWLDTVPTTIPAGLLGILAQALETPAPVAEQLSAVQADLPIDVPLGYLIDATTTYWVHPTTGQVIDAQVTETRNVVLDVPGLDATPLAPVLSLSYQGTPDSVANVVTEAEDLSGQLSLFGTTVPIALVVLGAVLLTVGAMGGRKEAEIDLTDAEAAPGATIEVPEEAPTGSTR